MQKKKIGENWKQKNCYPSKAHNICAYFLILFFCLITSSLYSQSILVKKYFDKDHKQIKEIYSIKNKNILEGEYTSYFQNGNIKEIGMYHTNIAEGIWIYYYENGNIKTKGNFIHQIPTGEWIYYYENGKIEKEGSYQNNKKTGIWNYYDENGKIKTTGEWKDGKKEGTWNYYDENKKLKSITIFKKNTGYHIEYYSNNKIKSEGKIVGEKSDSVWKYYNENGLLESTGLEKEGLKESYWEFYYPTTQAIAAKGNFKKGKKEGKWQYFYPSGKIYSEGIEKNGAQDSTWKTYYESGILLGEGNFTEGNGPYKEYYENGKIKINGYLKNGIPENEWNYYTDQGQLEGTAHFIQGKGTYQGFYKNGKVKMQGEIRDGKKIGNWTLYKSSGEVAGFYKNYDSTFTEIHNSSNSIDSSTFISTTTKKIFQKKKKTHRIRILKEGSYHGIILSTNPISPFVGSLPISIEKYYYAKRIGIEAVYFLNRNPFFKSNEEIKINSVYERGHFLAIRGKKYQKKKSFGMLYVGNELRVKYVNHMANITDLSSIQIEEKSIEYTFLVGNKFMQEYKKRGWVIDFYVGAGIGYRLLERKFISQPSYDAIFKDFSFAKWNIPLRLGLQVGYAF